MTGLSVLVAPGNRTTKIMDYLSYRNLCMNARGELCLGLLETDVLYPDLISDYTSYGTMFRQLLAEEDASLHFRHYQVTEGQLPERMDECDVYLITGSKAGVYDPLPWLEPLSDWIRAAFDAGRPMLGICFGHQILAHCLNQNRTFFFCYSFCRK